MAAPTPSGGDIELLHAQLRQVLETQYAQGAHLWRELDRQAARSDVLQSQLHAIEDDARRLREQVIANGNMASSNFGAISADIDAVRSEISDTCRHTSGLRPEMHEDIATRLDAFLAENLQPGEGDDIASAKDSAEVPQHIQDRFDNEWSFMLNEVINLRRSVGVRELLADTLDRSSEQVLDRFDHHAKERNREISCLRQDAARILNHPRGSDAQPRTSGAPGSASMGISKNLKSQKKSLETIRGCPPPPLPRRSEKADRSRPGLPACPLG